MNKYLIIGMIIVSGLLLCSAFILGKMTEEKKWIKEQSELISYYDSAVTSLDKELTYLKQIADSLWKAKQEIIIKWKIKEVEIHQTIAQDSSVVVQEYRNGLTSLNVPPDKTPDLSKREIGFGALFFNELKYKREDVANCNEINQTKDEIVNKLKLQNNNLVGEVATLKFRLHAEENKQDSFWENRIIPVIGAGGLYTQESKFDIGFFIGYGIRIN